MPESVSVLGGFLTPHAARAFTSAMFPQCQCANAWFAALGSLALRRPLIPFKVNAKSSSPQRPICGCVLPQNRERHLPYTSLSGAVCICAPSCGRFREAGSFPRCRLSNRRVCRGRFCGDSYWFILFQVLRYRLSFLSPDSRFELSLLSIRFSRALRCGCQVLSDRRRRVSCG